MKSASVVVQQHSRIILKMGILMPEICWVSKKKNKNSKWHLAGFLFCSYHKMHGPINIRFGSLLVFSQHVLSFSFSGSKFITCCDQRDVLPVHPQDSRRTGGFRTRDRDLPAGTAPYRQCRPITNYEHAGWLPGAYPCSISTSFS